MLTDRPQNSAGGIDANPVIGELKIRIQLHTRHMATGARLARRWRLMAHVLMAGFALAGIIIRQTREGGMRSVASKAGQFPRALDETPALGEVHRLVPDIPGIFPIGVFLHSGLAMACAAEIVHLLRAHMFRVDDGIPGGCVRLARAMATLTADP